jgi:hypothetical protein
MIKKIAERLRQDSEDQFRKAAKNADIARILTLAGYSEEAEQFQEVAECAKRNAYRLSRIAFTLENIAK